VQFDFMLFEHRQIYGHAPNLRLTATCQNAVPFSNVLLHCN